jgi:tRNA-splicing ligase RtcB (3'-phosphate/5'-hydroxy nucleic acid ligase)
MKTMSGTIRVYDSPGAPADRTLVSEFQGALRGVDLAAPAVVLPDFHHKHDMEMPSSIAVATRETIRPILTSSSVNCGMALIALDTDPPAPSAIDRFYRGVRERYPHPPTYRRDLTDRDVVACAARGGEFAVDRFGLDPGELERVEEGGFLPLERFGGAARLRRELPWLSLQLARLRFGTVGPTNHFIELQRVEEILDHRAAAILGVERGQTTLQYHAGGGVLASQIGRLFGRRRKTSRVQRLAMSALKPSYHLLSARSLEDLRTRIRLYFSAGFPAVVRHSPEGERLLLATYASMNYGFAFRLATYASLRRLARQHLGASASRLVVDSPHNSIYEESVGDETALVHRHNACRAFPPSQLSPTTAFGRVGQAVLLPGTHRTASYLCVADHGAFRTLYSAAHGAGTVIERLVDEGRSVLHPRGLRTRRYRYSDAAPIEDPQLDDRGVDEALAILTSANAIRPVARMRPLAVLN